MSGLGMSGVEFAPHSLRRTALLAPAAMAGVLLARPVGRHLNVRRTQAAAMAVAVAGAAVLVVQQIV
jgi:hypothetical protein